MHPKSSFDVDHILWTLTFAAQLVLLVVLLGRNRARRFPWFTAGVALFAFRLMADVLLSGRIANILSKQISGSLSDLSVIVSLLVLVEVARRAFVGLQRSLWIVNAVGLVVLCCGIMALWGPWPAWKMLMDSSTLGVLRLMQFLAQKGEMMVSLLSIGLGILVALFGRRYRAGWRTHTQQIVIGLSAIGVAFLVIQQALQSILRSVRPDWPRPEVDRIVALIGNLANANQAVYLVALLWWIAWLWLDEPATPATEQAAEELN
jgi:hypothetical protein